MTSAISILDLLQQDGFEFRHSASTGGGEYAGPCPYCGGNDRFHVWPSTGRFWCRICGKQGDSVQYLRDYRHLSFVDACREAGKPLPTKEGNALASPSPRPAWTPSLTQPPGAVWQEQATAFLSKAQHDLFYTLPGQEMLNWLFAQKGLTDATIRQAGLGINLIDRFDDRKTWGLSPATNANGAIKKQWLPAGLVIPLQRNSQVQRLRIRRVEGDPRYVVVSGSAMSPLVLSPDRAAAVVVESELDAILIDQEAGDLVTAVALGSASARPDEATHVLLSGMARIVVALDADPAGNKASGFWLTTYHHAALWPPYGGKDPADARQVGMSVRGWLTAGLFGGHDAFERFAIQTIDGGLTDFQAFQEARR